MWLKRRTWLMRYKTSSHILALFLIALMLHKAGAEANNTAP